MRKGGAMTKKKTKMTTAAANAPISGRPRTRAPSERSTRTGPSGLLGVGGDWVATGVLIAGLQGDWAA
ncbi:hypothetical protein Acsp07_58830 [Actinomycetospora sp. NBRC 106378]|nr:hypothetical protein Acsp07_58830 [Actinomycetospora sp. NBRC 106378]